MSVKSTLSFVQWLYAYPNLARRLFDCSSESGRVSNPIFDRQILNYKVSTILWLGCSSGLNSPSSLPPKDNRRQS